MTISPISSHVLSNVTPKPLLLESTHINFSHPFPSLPYDRNKRWPISRPTGPSRTIPETCSPHRCRADTKFYFPPLFLPRFLFFSLHSSDLLFSSSFPQPFLSHSITHSIRLLLYSVESRYGEGSTVAAYQWPICAIPHLDNQKYFHA